ncbi:MAG: THUMP domain-containing protein [Clostridium sp.]|nr:THUMP domain-containing protein [Clostridium sp.]
MQNFQMVAKTLKGLEEVLAEELRDLGAENVEPGKRMVSFEGNLETLYKANMCCRTALRILKPFYSFTAHTPDELYEKARDYDWDTLLSVDKTFCIDTVAFSEDFTHSHFVTYRVKDAIVDWFRDKYGPDQRPGVRLKEADVMINVHISGGNVTFSLDSSGESLHRRGYRVAQTDAPISEVLAAGIILMSGWRGGEPFVDPMCGSGTFLIEAALIAANIKPGLYRKSFAFMQWPDFDQDLYDAIYNDDTEERTPAFPIIGADISPAAIDIATRNVKSAGMGKYIELKTMPIAHWEEAPAPAGVLVTNPPYGERISVPDMEGLYTTIGNRLKNAFKGYHAWIIGYRDEYFQKIGLAPSQKVELLNGSLECELREYVIFEGDKKTFLANGGRLKDKPQDEAPRDRKPFDRERKPFDRDRKSFDKDQKPYDRDRKPFDRERKPFDRDRKPFDRERKPFDRDRKPFDRDSKSYDRDRKPFDRERKPFDRDRKPFDRDRKPFDRDRKPFDRERKPFDRERKPFDRDQKPERREEKSENPLALRRNPDALKMLQNRQPSLPPTMRKRGWRKKDEGEE